MVIAIVSFTPILIFLIIKNKFGSLDQLLISTANGQTIIAQSSYTYLSNIILLSLLLMIIILFFQLIVVHFVKQSLTQIGMIIGILIASQNTSIFSKGIISNWFPLNYLDLNRIIIGKSDITNLFTNNGDVSTEKLTNYFSCLVARIDRPRYWIEL